MEARQNSVPGKGKKSRVSQHTCHVSFFVSPCLSVLLRVRGSDGSPCLPGFERNKICLKQSRSPAQDFTT